jgi:type IV pilus assembly protein PilX
MRRRLVPMVRARQRGAALFVALILLVILTLIGVTAARMQTVEERMAQNDDNHQLAMESAEAALRQAGQALVSDAAWATNFAANAGGTYDLQTEIAGVGSIVDQPNWTASAIPYNGPALASVPVGPAGTVMENMPTVSAAGEPMTTGMYSQNPQSVVRVTAYAQGGDATSSVILQSIEQY